MFQNEQEIDKHCADISGTFEVYNFIKKEVWPTSDAETFYFEELSSKPLNFHQANILMQSFPVGEQIEFCVRKVN